MITCGGQATVPIVAAVSRAATVPYAEMVSTVASRSAGPGTRQNIDEFTRTTARALEEIGGARHGKAIIVLNPADPPILMRNTVFCALPEGTDHDAVLASVEQMVADVAALRARLPAEEPPGDRGRPVRAPRAAPSRTGSSCCSRSRAQATTCRAYAGNLDIMTAAAVRVGEAKAGAAGRSGRRERARRSG